MKVIWGAVFAVALGFSAVAPEVANANGAKKSRSYSSAGKYHASRRYRRRPQVKSYRRRRGGYSYSEADTINTYGDNRTTNNGANSYRFDLYTRQTPGGPFDHGFFFDSGISRNGGDSPYLN